MRGEGTHGLVFMKKSYRLYQLFLCKYIIAPKYERDMSNFEINCELLK